ncbi:hypothetical protein [Alteromonas sp. KUL49]|uniref:hypothetical protein n=1 Tax=Alteromonas sp. KUL49 TaxID=2480798 RepID=UPI00102F26D5|nr:hypothetical protein [Alteromonas sp. KUL49]TAP39689.1 hypothetical protein EYS00_10185 [Alteromonas sp. KUL49]GEA11677.1 hypothetical protein KUL49_20520 [Alteromonas sp. KUL49]
MPQCFIIASLGRCGSTFLSRSLNQYHNVFCDHELVVREPEYVREGHINLTINDSNFSFRNTIQRLAGSSSICGSKLSIPHYQWDDTDLLSKLVEKVSNEKIAVVHLSRCFLEHFVSRKIVEASGVWHVYENDDSPDKLKRSLAPKSLRISVQEANQFCQSALRAETELAKLTTLTDYRFFDYSMLTAKSDEIRAFLNIDGSVVTGESSQLQLPTKSIGTPHRNLIANLSEVSSLFADWNHQRETLLYEQL